MALGRARTQRPRQSRDTPEAPTSSTHEYGAVTSTIRSKHLIFRRYPSWKASKMRWRTREHFVNNFLAKSADDGKVQWIREAGKLERIVR
jgi:hypothetical protein